MIWFLIYFPLLILLLSKVSEKKNETQETDK